MCTGCESLPLGQIERYLKQAVVDKNAVVSSAALVSGIHLLKINAEIVKRWSNEVGSRGKARGVLAAAAPWVTCTGDMARVDHSTAVYHSTAVCVMSRPGAVE